MTHQQQSWLNEKDDTGIISSILLENFGKGGRSTSSIEEKKQLSSSLWKQTNKKIKEGRKTMGPEENGGWNRTDDGYHTFSACLLVMDENPRLIEWLAYHYHVLPLRYLIITVDPKSLTSPKYILDKWRNLKMDPMTIVEWNDSYFLPQSMVENQLEENAKFQYKRDRHRSRQKNFYRECLIEMKLQNRTYTILIDTDEFLVYNHPEGNVHQGKFMEWERNKQKQNKREQRIKPYHDVPSTRQPSSFIKYIRQEKEAGHPFYQRPCISVPRLQFGTVEDQQQDNKQQQQQQQQQPGRRTDHRQVLSELGLDPKQFNTIRWRNHAPRDDYVQNALAKVIIDVSQIDNIQSIPKFRSLHRPIPTICQQPWLPDATSGLRINHYLGSWEEYSYRVNDARRGGYERSYESWLFLSQQILDSGTETDDIIQPWLTGFIHDNINAHQAKWLLQDVGIYNHTNNTTNDSQASQAFQRINSNQSAWTFMHLDKVLQANESSGNDKRRVAFERFIRNLYNTTTTTTNQTTNPNHHSQPHHSITQQQPNTKSTLSNNKQKTIRHYTNATTTTASGYDSFSACLLVMDDNPQLIEWIAYHYHVLPLRYLIITVDPKSFTSPKQILDKWRNLNNDPMTIVEWNDSYFLPRSMVENQLSDDAKFQYKRDRHRSRQKNFYRQCLIEMKKQNRTYTLLIDTDEFLLYNHPAGNDQQGRFKDYEQIRQQLHEEKQKRSMRKIQRIHPFHDVPSTQQPSSLMTYLRQEKQAGHPFYQSPCISIPRLQFGTVEEQQTDTYFQQVRNNLGLDPKQFNTIRWRYHAPRDDFVQNALAKVIIDVSRIEDIQSIPKIRSLHRPIPTICQQPWLDDAISGLRINHYLGSWESYSYRINDARRGGYERSYESWLFLSQQILDSGIETDDIIQPWLKGFVQEHGPQAKWLLQDVGIYNHSIMDIQAHQRINSNQSAWTFMHLDKVLQANESSGNDKRRVAFERFIRNLYNTTITTNQTNRSESEP